MFLVLAFESLQLVAFLGYFGQKTQANDVPDCWRVGRISRSSNVRVGIEILFLGLLTDVFKVDECVSIPGVRPSSLPRRLLSFLTSLYLTSRDVVRCMMGYIVDMTIIMQGLFWLMWTRFGQSPCPVGEEHLRIVVDKFKESTTKRDVHLKIWASVSQMGVFIHEELGDEVLDKIVELLKENRFDPQAFVL